MSDELDDRDNTERNATEGTKPAPNSVDHVFQTIRLVTTLFPALVLILIGAIGFLGMSSIGSAVDLRIGAIVSRNEGDLSTLSDSIDELQTAMKSVRERLTILTGDVDRAMEALDYYSSEEYDPVGRFLALLRETRADATIVRNSETRKRAEIIFGELLRLHESPKQHQNASNDVTTNRQVDAEVLFNASGVASMFTMPQFAARLAEAAWQKQPTPEHAARMFRAKVATGELNEDQALNGILEIVNQLDTTHQLHLTLSEAFNVATGGGMTEKLIVVLEELKQKLGSRTPSYVWILQADALLVRGSKTDAERAIQELATGLEIALLESPMAYWFGSSVKEAGRLLSALENHPSFRDNATEMQDRFREILKANPEEGAEGRSVDGGEMRNEWPPLHEMFPFPPANTDLIEIGVDEPTVIDDPGWNWLMLRTEVLGDYRIRVEAGSAAVDPIVVVRDRVGNLLGFDDDGGEGLDSLLAVRLEQGNYSIGVGSASAVSDTVEGATVWIERAPL